MSNKIDKRAELIDFISKQYLYEIVDLVVGSNRTRGAVVFSTPEFNFSFLSIHQLILSSQGQRTDDVKGVLEIMKKYNPRKEVVILIVNQEMNSLEAVAVVELGWQSINLKGEK